MISLLRHFIGWIVGISRSREGLILENLALRQQLLVLHPKRPRRRLSTLHKLFWVLSRAMFTCANQTTNFWQTTTPQGQKNRRRCSEGQGDDETVPEQV